MSYKYLGYFRCLILAFLPMTERWCAAMLWVFKTASDGVTFVPEFVNAVHLV
jgi:hypothetical protein